MKIAQIFLLMSEDLAHNLQLGPSQSLTLLWVQVLKLQMERGEPSYKTQTEKKGELVFITL